MAVELNTSLSDSQALFFVWLEETVPHLQPLFDMNKAEYLPDAVDRYLGVASHGQAIMARFVLGVWRHDNQFNFDFTEAAAVLDKEAMQVITAWLLDPFWP